MIGIICAIFMPEATLVLDWFHIAMRSEHVLQAARGLGAGTSSDYLRVIRSASSRAPSGNFGTVDRAHVLGDWRAELCGNLGDDGVRKAA